ncbi:MAG: N-6 DNA methylase [Bacteroidaceae bacterium]|nr:N-6 DNA methylase [Bacteroidaceae bacterium]
MITIDNIKDVLSQIGFEKSGIGDYYKIDYTGCSMAVDFDNTKLIYPEENGLIVNDKTTSNFSHPENFVVFECVCRLLEKGYRPEHIELEPRWTLGHDTKGGKADILVKDEDGNPLLIIECKTAGAEFNKEKKNTEEDGGQLFSYWQQEGATRWLALYSSDFKNDELSYKCLCISCTDDANIVKIADKDTDMHIYKNARNDKERFLVWCETYGQQWLDDVVFCNDSQAYKIGIPPLRKGQLRDFTPEDRIVNRFEEILRHNNVSDKENAFNRLVALFICKLVDEIKKTDLDEVDFQYKQGADTYESLQDRLQRLHQQGMEEFMKEKIFYVEADYAERLFMQYTGRQRKAAIEDLNRTIRILKFYSNNDFAFKDVHNEELFFQNGKILVEVVQLFQPYRIVYPSKHQFLGDLFEQLLNKGFKQNEGQFFTPTPITRFIWDSLPLQHYVSNRDLPRIIDYACGAGHFLTEAVEAVNAVRKDADNTWVEKHVYGVEKDYRLARVSKISMFMNGAGGANIIFGDGLENYAEKGITNGSFDILVANPPYSVSGFKQHLKLKNNTFTIVDKITQDGSEIETLFVERTAQLLKPQGIAAIILPASILSNSSNSYIAAREQLLQNFMIRAIVNFGSKTFGATGTNTVVLFLERYNEPPQVSKMAEDIVDGIMNNTDCSEWQDKEVMEAYLVHQGIDEETYKQFLSRSMPWEILQEDSYFKSYAEVIANSSISYPKNATAERKAEIRLNKFYDYALSVERDKLYYFTLVRNQKTLVISAPTDNKEQKTFLGYDWSNRKGSEGIIINKKGGQLYDDSNRFASDTLASLIRFTFYGDVNVHLPEEIEKFAKTYWLKDMIDVRREQFDKAIKLSIPQSINVSSKYDLIELGSIAPYVTEKINYSDIAPESYISTDNILQNREGVKTYEGTPNVDRVTKYQKGDILVSNIRPYLKKIWFANNDGGCNNDVIVFRNQIANKCLNEYLYHVLSMDLFFDFMMANKNGMKMPRGDKRLIPTFPVPLPPLDIQQYIVEECKKVDEDRLNALKILEDSKQEIDSIVLPSFDKYPKVVLKTICDSFEYGTSEKSSTSGAIPVLRMGNIVDGSIDWNDLVYTDNMQDIEKHSLKKGDVLFNRTNSPIYVGKTALYEDERPAIFAGYLVRVNYQRNKIRGKYLSYILNSEPIMQHGFSVMTRSVNQANISASLLAQYEIPLPSLDEQDEIINKLEAIEESKKQSIATIANAPSRKQAILDKYLK